MFKTKVERKGFCRFCKEWVTPKEDKTCPYCGRVIHFVANVQCPFCGAIVADSTLLHHMKNRQCFNVAKRKLLDDLNGRPESIAAALRHTDYYYLIDEQSLREFQEFRNTVLRGLPVHYEDAGKYLIKFTVVADYLPRNLNGSLDENLLYQIMARELKHPFLKRRRENAV